MKNKTIPIRVSEAEEAEIKRRAEIIGISKSSFLREGVLHDNITVLDKGQDIVSEFVLLRKEISNAIRLQKTDALSEEKIMAKLDEISLIRISYNSVKSFLPFSSYKGHSIVTLV